jgi:hypothetical protein
MFLLLNALLPTGVSIVLGAGAGTGAAEHGWWQRCSGSGVCWVVEVDFFWWLHWS